MRSYLVTVHLIMFCEVTITQMIMTYDLILFLALHKLSKKQILLHLILKLSSFNNHFHFKDTTISINAYSIGHSLLLVISFKMSPPILSYFYICMMIFLSNVLIKSERYYPILV